MTPLRLLALCAAVSLSAAPVSLQEFLDAAAHSDAAKARQFAAQANSLQRRSELLTDGPALNAQAGYADAKSMSKNAMEYHVSVEKPFRTADTGRLERLFGTGSEMTAALEMARLQNRVYAYYIDACTLQEELWLLEDAKTRGVQMETLIRTGMEGGEFDRSAWLRSRLNVETLTLQIDDLNSRYEESFRLLSATAQTEAESLLCHDLPDTIALPSETLLADAPLLRQLENRHGSAKALASYRNSWLQEVTLAAGYDDEMDVQRANLHVSLPLGLGSRRANDREAAHRDALAAGAELRAMRSELAARVAAFNAAQQTRQQNLKRLNDEMIPEAYETTVLLEERFMGSEASYLEYIDSQKMLFALLMEGVQLRANALKAEAGLFADLGITPATKDKK
ncbi:TolC family protein [Sulfurimonas sp. HSL1-6]|uniref:TolC family protein n=1 Tax=Thiomicrolovo immobilis TaxID=3131935 RepID=UPI0031F8B955